MNNASFTEKLKEAELFNQFTSDKNNTDEKTALFAQIILLFAEEKELPTEQLKTFPAAAIIDYLKKSHVTYLNKKLPEIELQLIQLSNLPGELTETLASVFSWLQKNMEKHFRVEEKSLFPYIEDLEKTKTSLLTTEDLKAKYKDFSIQYFIDSHHDDVENKLEEIKKYIVHSLKSMEELFPYRILLQKLDDLEKDLRLHAKVEDEILVPLALEWEKK